MFSLLFHPVFLSIIDDVMNIITWSWWLWLFFLGWYFYQWAQSHVGFSPLLTLAVGGILIYFLVIEHPIIGSISIVFWVLITSGILFLLPMVSTLFNTFFHKTNPDQPAGRVEQQQQFFRQY